MTNHARTGNEISQPACSCQRLRPFQSWRQNKNNLPSLSIPIDWPTVKRKLILGEMGGNLWTVVRHLILLIYLLQLTMDRKALSKNIKHPQLFAKVHAYNITRNEQALPATLLGDTRFFLHQRVTLVIKTYITTFWFYFIGLRSYRVCRSALKLYALLESESGFKNLVVKILLYKRHSIDSPSPKRENPNKPILTCLALKEILSLIR